MRYLLFLSAAALLAAASCAGKSENTPLVPPPTAPLSRTVIGFGVVNVSYTQVNAEPADGGASQGFLRRGAQVRVIERRLVSSAAPETWVLVEGESRGWLREELLDIYDNELRARTASGAMPR
jgi:hypothetical protein